MARSVKQNNETSTSFENAMKWRKNGISVISTHGPWAVVSKEIDGTTRQWVTHATAWNAKSFSQAIKLVNADQDSATQALAALDTARPEATKANKPTGADQVAALLRQGKVDEALKLADKLKL